MTKRYPEVIAAVIAAAAMHMATADAASSSADACRPNNTAIYTDSGIAPRTTEPGSPAVNECPARVIRASFVASGERGGSHPAPGNRIPEPGSWATLFAGLLGAVSIIRRRMS